LGNLNLSFSLGIIQVIALLNNSKKAPDYSGAFNYLLTV